MLDDTLPRPVDAVDRVLTTRSVGLIVAWVAVLIVAAWSLLPALTPAQQPATVAPTAFSADRAMVHDRVLGQAPRPTGSARQAVVRTYLVDTFAALGLRTDAVTRDTCRPLPPGPVVCGHVTDLRTVVPGRDATSAVVLVAHYDSIAGGPGTSDDAYAVSSILEIARILRAGPQPRNNVVLLLTDGEEAGLLGAQAAVDGGLLPDPAHSVVLNVEARGNRAPFVMFETNGGAAGLVGALRDDPAHATSLAAAVYGTLGSDTDFTVFRGAGYAGMGFAVIGNSSLYDTDVDTLARADPGSVQEMGDALLAATRRLADADLTDVISGGPATYFPLLGVLVIYPPAVDVAVVVLAALLLATAIVIGRRVGLVSVRRVLAGAAAAVVLLFAATGLGLIAWQGALIARPEYIGLLSGMPYRPWLTAVGCVLVLAAIAVGWHAVIRRGLGATELACGVVAAAVAAGVASLIVLPAAAYLTGWPALAGAAITLGAVASPRVYRRLTLWWAAPAAVTVALLVPIVHLLFVAVGLIDVSIPLTVLALAAALVLAAVPATRRPLALATALLVGGVAGIGAGLALDVNDDAHPRQIPLVYVADLDSGRASWLSQFPISDQFLDHYLRSPAQPWADQFPLLYSPVYRSGPARPVPVAAPVVTPLGSTVDGDTRTIRVRITVADPAASLAAAYVDTADTPVIAASVAGRPVSGRDSTSLSTTWGWGVTRVGALAEGWDLEVTVRGTGPVRLRVLAQSAGLPTAAMDLPMPDTVTGGIYPAVRTLAARTTAV